MSVSRKVRSVRTYAQHVDPEVEPDATDFCYHREGDAQIVCLGGCGTLVLMLDVAAAERAK